MDLEDDDRIFDLPPVEQVKEQIREVRRALRVAEGKGRTTAIFQLKNVETRLFRELRGIQAEEKEHSRDQTGLEGADLEEVVSMIEGALRSLPSHLVDRIGEAVDELRGGPRGPLKVIPGGR